MKFYWRFSCNWVPFYPLHYKWILNLFLVSGRFYFVVSIDSWCLDPSLLFHLRSFIAHNPHFFHSTWQYLWVYQSFFWQSLRHRHCYNIIFISFVFPAFLGRSKTSSSCFTVFVLYSITVSSFLFLDLLLVFIILFLLLLLSLIQIFGAIYINILPILIWYFLTALSKHLIFWVLLYHHKATSNVRLFSLGFTRA